MEKILFVDDQWCTETGKNVIIGTFGDLAYGDEKKYDFVFETAYDGFVYSSKVVVDRVKQENPSAVVLDMNFGKQKDYGETILEDLINEDPSLPVIIHSSASDQALMERCLGKGAKAWLVKKASKEQLEEILNKQLSCEGKLNDMGRKNEKVTEKSME